MDVYLLDYENEPNLRILDRMQSDDELIVFYSEQHKTIKGFTWEQVNSLIGRSIKVYKVKKPGQEGLDKLLIFQLGTLINDARYKDSKFYIVSGDCGYDEVIDFAKGRDISRIDPNPSHQQAQSKDKEQNNKSQSEKKGKINESQSEQKADDNSQMRSKLRAIRFKDGEKLSDSDIEWIISTVNQDNHKVIVNNKLSTHFGGDK